MFPFLTVIFPLLVKANPEYDYYYDYGDQNYSVAKEVVLVNSNLTLECGAPFSGTTLYHNHVRLDPLDPRVLDSSDEESVSLNLTQYADSGRWTCESSRGVAEKAVIVSDVDSLSVLVSGEQVKNLSVIFFRRDLDTEIICSVVSGGERNVPLVWEYDSGPLEFDLETFQSSERGISYSIASLSTQHLIKSQATRAICRSGSKLMQFQLSEEFRPEFTISRSPGFGLQILEDMAVTLRCTVESSPPCVPVWEHNGNPLPSIPVNQSNAAEISFQRITGEAEGWYQCSTQHKFGNFSSVGYYLNVKPKPKVTEVDTVTSSMLSDQFLLVESNSNDGRKCSEDNLVADLTLPKVYTAENKVSVLEGEPARIYVKFCSNPQPDRIVWLGPALALLPGSNSSRFTAAPIAAASEGCQAAELIGEQLETGDSGLYLLLVRNSYHIAEGQVYLEVISNQTLTAAATASCPSLLWSTYLILLLIYINL